MWIICRVRTSYKQGDVNYRIVQMVASPYQYERVEVYDSYLYTHKVVEPSKAGQIAKRTLAMLTHVAEVTKEYKKTTVESVNDLAVGIVKYLRESGIPRDQIQCDGDFITLSVKESMSGENNIYRATARRVLDSIPSVAGKFQPKQLEAVIRSKLIAAKDVQNLDEYNQIAPALVIAAHYNAAQMGKVISQVNDSHVFVRYASIMKGGVIQKVEKFTSYKIGRYLGNILVWLTIMLMCVTGSYEESLKEGDGFIKATYVRPWQILYSKGPIDGLWHFTLAVVFTAVLTVLTLGSIVRLRKVYRKWRLDAHEVLIQDHMNDGTY